MLPAMKVPILVPALGDGREVRVRDRRPREVINIPTTLPAGYFVSSAEYFPDPVAEVLVHPAPVHPALLLDLV